MDLYHQTPPLIGLMMPHAIPYAIIIVNFILFKTLRSFVDRIFAYYLLEHLIKKDKRKRAKEENESNRLGSGGKVRFVRLLIGELISTCELCADCAELNIVYEKHGSLAYALALFLLTYLWIDAFGEAHTTPGYLIEDYFLVKGNEMLKTGDAYARFIGQSLALPLAWRFASLYWNYRLISEHSEMLVSENCKSSLTTSTINGFLVEFLCCLLCRSLELIGHKLLDTGSLSKRFVSLVSSFACTVLVVVALEISGGYFNPVLAASLEFGCKGIHFYQHVLVFWLGPLFGHLLARFLYRRVFSEQKQLQISNKKQTGESRQLLTRSVSQKRRKRAD